MFINACKHLGIYVYSCVSIYTYIHTYTLFQLCAHVKKNTFVYMGALVAEQTHSIYMKAFKVYMLVYTRRLLVVQL